MQYNVHVSLQFLTSLYILVLTQGAGVAMEERSGAIQVDEYSRTNVPSIWAIGDVTDRMNLTPVALMEGKHLAATLFGGEQRKPDYTNVCCVLFRKLWFCLLYDGVCLLMIVINAGTFCCVLSATSINCRHDRGGRSGKIVRRY